MTESICDVLLHWCISILLHYVFKLLHFLHISLLCISKLKLFGYESAHNNHNYL